MSRMAAVQPMPFIVGVSRSGTTLMRLMLDAHPELAIPPETHFIPRAARCSSTEAVLEVIEGHERFPDYQVYPETLRSRIESLEAGDVPGALRAFYAVYAERFGKRRYGDKTPRYLRSMPLVQGMLPEARFLHLIRDGRDVAASGLDAGFGAATVAEWAEQWRSHIESGRLDSERLSPGSYMEIHYEDLVLDTAKALREVCEFAGLPWDERMLNYHPGARERIRELGNDLADKSGEERIRMHALTSEPPQSNRVGSWKARLAPEQVREFEEVARGLLEKLGYANST